MTAALSMQRAQSGPADLQIYKQPGIQENFEKALFAGKFEDAQGLLYDGAEIDSERIHVLLDVAYRKMDPHLKVNIIAFLLNNHAFINQADGLGRTVLHHAARLGELLSIREILARRPNFGLKDHWGYTALHEIAYSRELDHTAVDAWVAAGGPLDEVTKKNETALYISCEKLHYDVARSLFDHGAAVDTVSNSGKTAFSSALRHGIPDAHPSPYGQMYVPEFNQLSFEMLQRLDVNAPVSHGRTPLLLIAQAKRINDEGHPINTTAHIRYLLDNGASLEARDYCGDTPIHIAARRGDEQLALLLVGRSRLDLTNNDGQTALQIAEERGHEGIVKILSGKA